MSEVERLNMKFKPRTWLVIFFALACLGSWLPIFALLATDTGWSSGLGRALSVWYSFPPMLAALFVMGPALKQPIVSSLGISFKINRWWSVALLLPLILLGLSLGITWLLDGSIAWSVEELIANKRAQIPAERLAEFEEIIVQRPPQHPLRLILMALPAGVLTFNLLVAFAEELGFRGFLFKELAGRFWSRSFKLALLWSLWWLPSVVTGRLFGSETLIAMLLIACWCLSATPVLVYLRARTGSVLPVAITRSVLLAMTAPASDITFGSAFWLQPIYGISMSLAWLIILALFVIYDRKFATTKLS